MVAGEEGERRDGYRTVELSDLAMMLVFTVASVRGLGRDYRFLLVSL